MRQKAPRIGCFALLLLLLITAHEVQAQGAPCVGEHTEGVYLYEYTQYRGRCAFFAILQGALPNEKVLNLGTTLVGNNTASSIRIVGNYRVLLYAELGLDGASTTFVGDDPNFFNDAIGTKRASSMLVIRLPGQCNRGEGVYLFEHAHCQGRATQITENMASLFYANIGNNTASSLAIGGDYAVTVYRDANFQGEANVFVRSDADFSDNHVGNDRVSSVRIRVGGCDDLAGVYLYEHANHTGRCAKFKESSANLTFEYIKNDTASSIRMIGHYAATVYEHANYHGTTSTFTQEDPNFGGERIGHDRASSLRLEPGNMVCDGGPGVYLYALADFQGRCAKFTDDIEDLTHSSLGRDVAASIRFVGEYQAKLYSNPAFAGCVKTFTTNHRYLQPITEADPALELIGPIPEKGCLGRVRSSSIRIFGPEPEEHSIGRVQLRLWTAQAKDAATADDVVVSLNPENVTWLDSARYDDFAPVLFEQAGPTYDLLLTGVSHFKDIHWLTITKTGSDAWCISRLDLVVNGNVVYTQSFTPCHWLDHEQGHTRDLVISYSQLRQAPAWRRGTPFAQLTFSRDELEQRIEGVLGHFLHDHKEANWGDLSGRAYVEVENRKKDNQTLHVDLDLAGDSPIPFTDPEVDIDFDLQLACDQGTITLEVLNLSPSARFPWYAELAPPFPFFWLLSEYVEHRVEAEIKHGFPKIREELNLPIADCAIYIIDNNYGSFDVWIDLFPPSPTPRLSFVPLVFNAVSSAQTTRANAVSQLR